MLCSPTIYRQSLVCPRGGQASDYCNMPYTWHYYSYRFVLFALYVVSSTSQAASDHRVTVRSSFSRHSLLPQSHNDGQQRQSQQTQKATLMSDQMNCRSTTCGLELVVKRDCPFQQCLRMQQLLFLSQAIAKVHFPSNYLSSTVVSRHLPVIEMMLTAGTNVLTLLFYLILTVGRGFHYSRY